MHLRMYIRVSAGYKLKCGGLGLGKTLSDRGQIVSFEMIMLRAVHGC